MPANSPSLQSIIEYPTVHDSRKEDSEGSIREADRIANALSADRFSLFEFRQVMRYVFEMLHPVALSIVIPRVANPEINRQLCYDAPLSKFKEPRAARLWALLESLPPQGRLLIPDSIIESWLRHPHPDIRTIGTHIARTNRLGIVLPRDVKSNEAEDKDGFVD